MISPKFRKLRDYLADNSATYQSMTSADIVTALTTKNITVHDRMTVAALQEELTVIGKAIAVATFLESTNAETAGLRRFLEMLLMGKQEDFNLMATSAQELMNALITLEVLTADDKAALEASITKTESITDQLGYKTVTAIQIDTLKGDLSWA